MRNPQRMNKCFLALVLFALLLSCSKNNGTNEDKYPYYFTATINGSAVKYEANDINSNDGCGTSAPSSANIPSDYDIYQGTFFVHGFELTKNVIYVHILKYFTHEPSGTELLGMLHLGDYPYGVGDVSSSTINGASIEYIDANGKGWSSEIGSQTGSSFTVNEISDNPDGTSVKIFKASFNCKLYDAAGASIEVKNAVFRGLIFNP